MTAVALPGVSFDAAGNVLLNGRYQPRILGASAVAATAPADTNENILATISLPAGVMGINGVLRIWSRWTVTASANAKTLRIRLGGIGGTAHFLQAFGATDVTQRDCTEIANRGSASSQIGRVNAAGSGGFGASTGAFTTSSIDTTVATTLVLTGVKASAGETLTLESYLVELLLP